MIMLKIENSTSKLIRLRRDLMRHQESLNNSLISDSMLKDSYNLESIRKIKSEMEVLFETASFC